MFLYLISFKIVTVSETYSDPREEFKKREEAMRIKIKQMNEQMSKLMIEQEMEDLGPESGAGIQYNEFSISSIYPKKLAANEKTDVLLFVEPKINHTVYCKFGSIVKHGIIGLNNSIKCQSPALQIGEIYIQVSNDRRKWSLPILVQVYDPNAPTYNTPSALIFMGVAVAGYIVYKLYTRHQKAKKGAKHKYEDDLNDQYDERPTNTKKYKETKQREITL